MNHYQTNFALVQHHNWSLSDIDSLIPFEREIYVALLQAFIKDEEAKDNNKKQSF